MLKAFSEAVNVLTSRSIKSTICDLRPLHRKVSTNAAIHRGLRKSKHGYGHEQSSPSVSRNTPRAGPGDYGRQSRFADSPRARRPNHQQKQDVDDMEESARINKLRISPRKEQYLRGGTRGSFSRPQRDSSERSRRAPEDVGQSPPSFNRRAERLYQRNGLEKAMYSPPTPQKSSITSQSRSPRRNEDAQYLRASSVEEKAYVSQTPREHSSFRFRAVNELSQYSKFRSLEERPETSPAFPRPFPVDARQEHRYGRPESDQKKDQGTTDRPSRDQARPDETQWPRRNSNIPLSIPYTTPASEFLYGTSVITAALKSSRRKLYKLYMYDGENREVQEQDAAISKLALAREVVVTRVKREWLRLMDKMSSGRPHNGYILEASPLPRLPVTGLEIVNGLQKPLRVSIGHQSREDEAVNGTNPDIKYMTSFSRYPFVLMLDGILDPGNLGAILRTAYFLGVDAVAISNRNSAPFTPVTLKASAGASESLPLLSISQSGAFIDVSQTNGWKFYAASAPSRDSNKPDHFTTSTLKCPLKDYPVVLMLGGEGEGLRWNLQKKADFVIGVDGIRNGHGGVDSLNVSVAAGLLCEAFLRKPAGLSNSAKSDSFESAEIPKHATIRKGRIF